MTCLNRSTNLDAIQRGPKKKNISKVKPPRQNTQLQIAAKPSVLCCYLASEYKWTIPPIVKLGYFCAC